MYIFPVFVFYFTTFFFMLLVLRDSNSLIEVGISNLIKYSYKASLLKCMQVFISKYHLVITQICQNQHIQNGTLSPPTCSTESVPC